MGKICWKWVKIVCRKLADEVRTRIADGGARTTFNAGSRSFPALTSKFLLSPQNFLFSPQNSQSFPTLTPILPILSRSHLKIPTLTSTIPTFPCSHLDTIMGPRIEAFLCSILYENCAFLHIFWGENGTVILVGCNSPFCENCFSLRFRDFSKSRSNENYFSQTFSRLKASSRKIKAWRLRLEARTARLTGRTAPSNGPDGPSNGPDGPPNGPDGGAGDRRLRPG